MQDIIKKMRLKVNESIWRLTPRIMFSHYRKDGLRTQGEGNAAYPVIGILKDFMGMHEKYVKAAHDLSIPYRVVDIMDADWLQSVKTSKCNLFFYWPNPYHSAWKTMYDERISILNHEMSMNVYPKFKELWFWESKRRMSYWMNAHNVKQPKTWIFYDYHEAVSFAAKVDIPVVFKPDFGDCGRGVRIVRSNAEAISLAKKAFTRGYAVEGHHPSERVWGCVVFQEYIRNAKEWRMIKIGDSLFGYRKGKKGELHSGSKLVEYATPPKALLDLVMDICEKGDFACMSFDILEDEGGGFHTTELQTVFGGDKWAFQMVIDGSPGRYRIERKAGQCEYVFERGIFCENDCCNLRIKDGLMTHYGIDVGFWEKPGDYEKAINIARKYRHLITKGF